MKICLNDISSLRSFWADKMISLFVGKLGFDIHDFLKCLLTWASGSTSVKLMKGQHAALYLNDILEYYLQRERGEPIKP